jgi:hydrogenase maturation protease
MPNLRRRLEQLLTGRVCFMGLGNVEYGDDGFGVRLAEDLINAGVPDVIIAAVVPDRWIGQLAGFNHIVFLDAIEFGGAPGDVVFLDSAEMAARFPQISTHKISLGVLAQWVEATGATKAWLLGAQPESLKAGQQITPALRKTVDLLCELIKSRQLGAAAREDAVNTLKALTEVNA